MRVLLSSMLAHVVVASMAPSPWWAPDLTLAGLTLAIIRKPRQWAVLASLVGVWAAVWAVRSPLAMLLGSLLLGWVIHLLAVQWDLTGLRMQCVVVAAASLLQTVGAFWLAAHWSLALLGLALVHVLVTGCAVPCLKGVLGWGTRLRGEGGA